VKEREREREREEECDTEQNGHAQTQTHTPAHSHNKEWLCGHVWERTSATKVMMMMNGEGEREKKMN